MSLVVPQTEKRGSLTSVRSSLTVNLPISAIVHWHQ
jgi:hypothetical protein